MRNLDDSTSIDSSSVKEKRSLDQIELGAIAEVESVVTSNPELRNRLLAMGVVKNTKLRVSDIAPLGDPINIVLRGFKLALRKSEAKSIKLK